MMTLAALRIHEAGLRLNALELPGSEPGREAAEDMAVGVEESRFAGIEGRVWEEGGVPTLQIFVAE